MRNFPHAVSGTIASMRALKIISLLILAAVLAIVALVLLKVTPRIQPMPQAVVANFEECAAAGNPVMESYPRQCRTEDGRIFVEEISDVFPFSTTTDFGMVAEGCAVAGCSGQLCVPAIEADNIMTTCEYRAEYVCYKNAKCEHQSDGSCGWTQTPQLQQCLANPPAAEGELKLEVM